MPVSRALLQELCAATDLLFTEYDATLVKAMLITALGVFMRISEYTEVRKDAHDHNIDADAVDITNDGIGVIFRSDKTSNIFSRPQHRLASWDFLPEGS